MPQLPAATSPIKPGDIVNAEVTQTSGDTSFLRLRAANGSVSLGRLGQADSLCWADPNTLEKLPAYKAGKTLQVMVKHGKREAGHLSWFTHERWAHDNPWPELKNGATLRDGDRITGWVVAMAAKRDSDLTRGYIIQLDTAEPICDELGIPWLQEVSDGSWKVVLQPDLEVFLPAAELPESSKRAASVLELAVGERVTALVLDAQRTLPDHPLVSVRRMRAAVDTHFWNELPPDGETAMKAAFDLAPRRAAQLAVATPEPASALPWAGRRIDLVDDQRSAAEALAATLRHRGANVVLWLPADEAKGWRDAELHSSVRKALASNADLVLVDDGLPQPHRGEDALVLALKAAGVEGQPMRPRVWLMSGSTPATAGEPTALRALGIQGALRRPLRVADIQTLLDNDEHEDWAWKGETSPLLDVVSLHTPRSLDQLLRFAQRALQQDYAVLLAVGPGGQLCWRASSGRVPFEPSQLGEVVSESELRLLVQGRQAQLALSRGSSLNLIHPQTGHCGRWQALGSGKTPEFLLGVGSQRGIECGTSWPWLVHAARAELEAQQLNTLFQNNTAALSAGWLAEGYAHETVHDRQDLLAVVEAMETLCGRAQAQGTGIAPQSLQALAAQTRRVVEAQGAKAQSLLRRHRQRSAPLALRAWLADVEPMLFKQCSESGSVLRVGETVPDLVLPVPEWLLTLCVVNLVLNAVKHQASQEAAWVRLDFELRISDADDQSLCIRVQDNGWGLTPEARSQLFSPGTSEAPDPETRHGIGLWLSQTLARQAGGELRLAWSYRGFGACFELVVPVTLG